MRFLKGSPEYDLNWDRYHEMSETIPMTRSERSQLLQWVKAGNSVDSNPWKCFELDGSPMNFLKARRILFGASHGPWDSWEFEPFLKADIFGNLSILN